MAGPADEIIVRLTADSSGLSAGLQSGADQVQSASDQMAQAAQAAAAQVNEAQASMAQASGGAADAFDASTTAMQASMDALAANITAATEAAKAEIAEMVAAAGGGTAGLAVSQAVAADAAAFNAAVMARAAAAGNLSAAMAGGITSTEGLAAAESALDEAMATGAVTASEFAAIQVELGAAEDALTAQVDANTASVEANTAANEENAVSGAGRTHGVYGVFSAVMAVGRAVTSPAVAPLAALAAALVAVDAASIHAEDQISALNRGLLVSGNSAGLTAGALQSMADSIGESNSTIGDASAVLAQLAASGQFTATQMQSVGQAAVVMSQLTGQSATQAASALIRMAADPQAAIDQLNAKFHFLNATQKENIQTMLQDGNASGAVTAAFAALEARTDSLSATAQQSIGIWTRLGDAIANAWNKAGERIAAGTGHGTLEEQLKMWQQTAKVEGPSAAPDVAQHITQIQAALTAQRNATHEAGLLHAEQQRLAVHSGPGGLHADEARLKYAESAGNMDATQRAAYARSYWEGLRGSVPAGSAVGEAAYQHLEHATHVHASSLAAPGLNSTHAPTVGAMGHFDTHMMHAEAAHIAAQQHAAAITEAVQKTSITSQASHSVAMLGMQRSHVEAMASMGTIGGASAIEQEQKIADSIYAIKLRELEKEKALAATKPEETARINSEIVRLQDTHTATMIGLSDKASAQQIKSAEAVVQPVMQTFSQITAGFVEGTLTRQQAELRLGDALVAETINTGMQMLMHHIAIDNAKTLATAEGEAKRLALHVWGEAEALAIQAATAIKWILTEAAKAAAGAFSAMAAIPVVGPALAVAAGAATFVAVEALVSNVASAQGGFERVPFDNMPAVLHKDEQVLPAQYAEGLRNLVAGGGGSTYHYHIHANDAAGFEGMLKRNPGALVRALGHAGRTGHTFA